MFKADVFPQRAVVGSTLKRTNILVNDQHYRYVDLLWREWSRCNRGQAKNSRQVFEENKKLFRGFESFCLLLIGRALTGSGNDNDKGFGIDAIANLIPTRSGQPILFRGALGEVSLTCKCSKCNISWGTRSCGSCGKKYPYIQITGIESQNRQPAWVERTLGREVLAVPCWRENNHSTFICPHCGTCNQAELSHVEACIRCQSSR